MNALRGVGYLIGRGIAFGWRSGAKSHFFYAELGLPCRQRSVMYAVHPYEPFVQY